MFRFQEGQHVMITVPPCAGTRAVVVNPDVGDGFVTVKFDNAPVQVDILATALIPIADPSVGDAPAPAPVARPKK
jgi:hypothetical protein